MEITVLGWLPWSEGDICDMVNSSVLWIFKMCLDILFFKCGENVGKLQWYRLFYVRTLLFGCGSNLQILLLVKFSLYVFFVMLSFLFFFFPFLWAFEHLQIIKCLKSFSYITNILTVQWSFFDIFVGEFWKSYAHALGSLGQIVSYFK